jgi:LysR family transcriptional regulator, nitrogen assimilation regulatory protein
MTLDIRRIGYFIAVYEEGSISRAANRENIAQPALSVQIKQLEADFSVQLFERSAQGVQPTCAGRRFYEICLELRRNMRFARQQMLDFGSEVAGTICVGVMPAVCHGPLATILSRYSDIHPLVDVRVVEANSGTLAEGVVSGDIDFAICNQPAGQTGLKLRPLFSDKLMLVSGCATSLIPWNPYRLEDVVGLKLILPSYRHSLRRTLDTHIKAGAIRPARVMEIDGLGATLQLVEASDWSTLLPSAALITSTSTRRLIVNPVVQPEVASDIYEIHSPDRPLSLPAERMVHLARDILLKVPARTELLQRAYGNDM